jgi:hypothetical protein
MSKYSPVCLNFHILGRKREDKKILDRKVVRILWVQPDLLLDICNFDFNPHYERLKKVMFFSLYSYLQPIQYYRQRKSEAHVFYLNPATPTPPPPFSLTLLITESQAQLKISGNEV